MKHTQLIIAILVGLTVLVPTTYWGVVNIAHTMEEISENTRHRLEQKLERMETRMWHLENDFPDGPYPPGHIEKIKRLGREIDRLLMELGYGEKE